MNLYLDHPEWIWLILIPVIALLLIGIKIRKNAKEAEQFSEEGQQFFNSEKSSLSSILLLASLLLSLFALLGPKSNPHLTQVIRTGRDLTILLDLSRSMDAEGRIDTAKRLLDPFLAQKIPGRVALWEGTSIAFPIVPLSMSQDFLRTQVRIASTENVEGDGSDFVQQFKSMKGLSGDLLLVSDGEDLVSTPREVIDAAKKVGVPVSTLLVGSQKGEITVSGKQVETKANRELMREIALATGGEFFDAKTLSSHALSDWFNQKAGTGEEKSSALSFTSLQIYPLVLSLILLSFYLLREGMGLFLLLFTLPLHASIYQGDDAFEAGKIETAKKFYLEAASEDSSLLRERALLLFGKDRTIPEAFSPLERGVLQLAFGAEDLSVKVEKGAIDKQKSLEKELLALIRSEQEINFNKGICEYSPWSLFIPLFGEASQKEDERDFFTASLLWRRALEALHSKTSESKMSQKSSELIEMEEEDRALKPKKERGAAW